MDCGRVENSLWSEDSKLNILFGNHGCHILLHSKEEKHHPAHCQPTVHKLAFVMVREFRMPMALVVVTYSKHLVYQDTKNMTKETLNCLAPVTLYQAGMMFSSNLKKLVSLVPTDLKGDVKIRDDVAQW